MRTTQELISRALDKKLSMNRITPVEFQLLLNELSPPHYGPPTGLVRQVDVGDEDGTVIVHYVDLEGNPMINTVLDCHGMYSVHNLGFNNASIARLKKARIAFEESFFPECSRERHNTYFLRALIAMRRITGLDKFIPKTSGTTAVETALKIAVKYWHSKNRNLSQERDIPMVIAAKNNFHGRSMRPISLSSSPVSRNGFGPFLPTHIVPFGDIQALETTLVQEGKHTAAVILEPIQGEGGVIIPPQAYLSSVQKLCRAHDVIFILDEIQTGFGRVGGKIPEELFAYQSYRLTPDLVCFGKAAGGGVPFTFVGGKREFMDLLEEGTEGETFSGYSLGCISFEIVAEETLRRKLAVKSKRKGQKMLHMLQKVCEVNTNKRAVKDIRGRGLFIGIELYPSFSTGKEFSYALLLEGVRAKETGENGQTIRFAPPLTITDKQIEDCVDAVRRAFCRLGYERDKIKQALASQKEIH